MDAREKVAGISILINTALAIFKFILGSLSGSVAIVADGIHSTSDIVASIAVLIGLKISQRKSKQFPYGLYKVENIIAIVSAMAIFFAGYEIVKEVIFQPVQAEMTHIVAAMIGVCVTIGVTYLFSRYEIRVGKAVGSPSLIADGKHVQTDMLSTIVVLASLIGRYFGFALDKPAAIVVAGFIAYAGWEILIEGVKVLLDASLEKSSLQQIGDILLEEPAVNTIKTLTGRNSGSYKFIETEITLNVRDLKRAHAISSTLEQNIKSRVQNVDHVLIHYEPVIKDTQLVAVMLDELGGDISGEFGAAPYIALIRKHIERGEIAEQKTLINPFISQKTGKGIALAEFLAQQHIDVVFTKTPFHGKGPEYVFSDANIRIHIAHETRFDEFIQTIKTHQILE